MPDDISWGAFSLYNQGDGPSTPNIDALARESVQLTDFHVSPTCSPSRAAFLTGRHNDATGVWHTIMGREQLRRDEITMADVFKANDYATGMFFKWHLGDNYPFRPQDFGFDHVAWSRGGGVGQQPDFWGNTNIAGTFEVNGEWIEMTDEEDGIPGAFSNNFFFNRAMDFMGEQIEQGKPFFTYLTPATAHTPHFLPPDAAAGVSPLQGTVENIDKNMGRLLAFLKEQGVEKNTIVIFTTDNGDRNHLYRAGKATPYEGGHRVPAFVRWENGGMGGLGQARQVDQLTAHYDLLPTLMDLLDLEDAVAERPANLAMHGQSLSTILDNSASNDDSIFAERAIVIDNMRVENLLDHKYKQASVMRDQLDEQGEIQHKWRLQVNKDERELYDVMVDSLQEQDLSADPVYAELIKRLSADYESYWEIISARSDEYTRIIIGDEAEPVSRINSMATHDSSVWHQGQVANGQNVGSWVAVEFAQTGTYTFDLHRWPIEIGDYTSLTTAPADPVFTSKGVVPLAFPIASARLQIYNGDEVYFDESKAAGSDADAVSFKVDGLPAGPAFLRTDFFDAEGEVLFRAYYTYVERV